MPATDPLVRLIGRRHPDHARFLPLWDFIRDALWGLPSEYAVKHLWKHPREAKAVFEQRQKRAADHRYNLTRAILECYVDYLFRQRPTVAESLPDCATSFLAAADREGRPAVDLAGDVAYWGLAYDVVWIGVDKPPRPASAATDGEQSEPLSAQRERELGLRPYAYVVHPQAVLDGRIVRGQIEWLLVEETERDDADPWESSGDQQNRYRLWTRFGWTLIAERKGSGPGPVRHEIVGEGPHPLGEVPFVPVRFGGGAGFASVGLLSEIAHLDRAVFNHMSLVDEIHYGVTFPQLVYPHRGELYQPRETGGDGEAYDHTPVAKAILQVGVHDVIPFQIPDEGAAGPTPAYISPPSEPAEELRKAIDEMVRLALALAALDGEVATESAAGGARVAASGVSKAYTFEKLNRRLAGYADVLQTAFAKVLRLVCRWQGEDPEALGEVPWDFPDAFDVKSLFADIEQLVMVLGAAPPSPTLRAELWKDAAAKLLVKRSPQVLDQVNAELEAGTREALAGEGEQLDRAQAPGGGETGEYSAGSAARASAV